MLNRTSLFVAVFSLIFAMLPSMSLADKFDDAEATAKKFIEEYEKIRKLTIDEQKELIAIGRGFDEDAEASLLKSAAERVWSHVNDQFYKLKELRDTFEKQLLLVLSDVTLKEKYSNANGYRKRIIEELWPRIERMMLGVNAGNNPVFKHFTQLGNDAHVYYQGLSGECHVKEFPLANGKADCIKRTPPRCEVIEIKANNSNSISRGRTEARDYAKELNKMGDDFSKLVNKDSGFKDCKEFIPRVACYVANLNVDNDGNVMIQSLGWGWCD